MAYRLSEHDKKVLRFGAYGVAAILAYSYILAPWAADWHRTRVATAANMRTIASLAGSVDRRLNQADIVPVFEMPVAAEQQQHLFKTRFNKQLTDAGIQAKSLQYITAGKTPNNLGFTVSKLKCDGKCTMPQAIRLLASLPENPYFLGIDELRLSCDPKKREETKQAEMTLSITVSTFCSSQ
jgi:hypothetical protein